MKKMPHSNLVLAININLESPFGIIKTKDMIEPNKGEYRVKCNGCGSLILVQKESYPGKYIQNSFEMFGRAKFQCKRCRHENYVQKP